MPIERFDFVGWVVLKSLILSAVCIIYFGWGLSDEPHFVDESAYISQAFYTDLYREGRWNHPAWLDYAGYDLPPLPKYFIGTAFWLKGYRRPTLTDAHSWYRDTSRQFVDRSALLVARWPSVLLGAGGCVAISWLGTMAFRKSVGLLAAFLLAINPLYQLHARRAMSDVPSECFILVALAGGMLLWKRASERKINVRWWLLASFTGVMIGMATLSKLNGVLSGFILAGWVSLGLVMPTISGRSKVLLGLATGTAAVIAFATFVVLNPFLTAHPPEPVAPEIADLARMNFTDRVYAVYDHRESVSRHAMTIFPHDALPTVLSRVAVVGVQGFGRFGPLGMRGRSDSTRRFAWKQDWGALVWLPCVLAGLIALTRKGRDDLRRQHPPLPWLILIYCGVVGIVVTAFIPLAWDRYLMSIQPATALVGASGLVAGATQTWARLSRRESVL